MEVRSWKERHRSVHIVELVDGGLELFLKITDAVVVSLIESQ